MTLLEYFMKNLHFDTYIFMPFINYNLQHKAKKDTNTVIVVIFQHFAYGAAGEYVHVFEVLLQFLHMYLFPLADVDLDKGRDKKINNSQIEDLPESKNIHSNPPQYMEGGGGKKRYPKQRTQHILGALPWSLGRYEIMANIDCSTFNAHIGDMRSGLLFLTHYFLSRYPKLTHNILGTRRYGLTHSYLLLAIYN
ncbi:hypothetical protein ACJX0J_031099 [Zea mays]